MIASGMTRIAHLRSCGSSAGSTNSHSSTIIAGAATISPATSAICIISRKPPSASKMRNVKPSMPAIAAPVSAGRRSRASSCSRKNHAAAAATAMYTIMRMSRQRSSSRWSQKLSSLRSPAIPGEYSPSQPRIPMPGPGGDVHRPKRHTSRGRRSGRPLQVPQSCAGERPRGP